LPDCERRVEGVGDDVLLLALAAVTPFDGMAELMLLYTLKQTGGIRKTDLSTTIDVLLIKAQNTKFVSKYGTAKYGMEHKFRADQQNLPR
jgi:hypothetical protein